MNMMNNMNTLIVINSLVLALRAASESAGAPSRASWLPLLLGDRELGREPLWEPDDFLRSSAPPGVHGDSGSCTVLLSQWLIQHIKNGFRTIAIYMYEWFITNSDRMLIFLNHFKVRNFSANRNLLFIKQFKLINSNLFLD